MSNANDIEEFLITGVSLCTRDAKKEGGLSWVLHVVLSIMSLNHSHFLQGLIAHYTSSAIKLLYREISKSGKVVTLGLSPHCIVHVQ